MTVSCCLPPKIVKVGKGVIEQHQQGGSCWCLIVDVKLSAYHFVFSLFGLLIHSMLSENNSLLNDVLVLKEVKTRPGS